MALRFTPGSHDKKPDLPVIFATGYSPDMALLGRKSRKRTCPCCKSPTRRAIWLERSAKLSTGVSDWSLTNKVDTSFARVISVEYTWHRLKRRFAEASRRGTPKFPAGCIWQQTPPTPGGGSFGFRLPFYFSTAYVHDSLRNPGAGTADTYLPLYFYRLGAPALVGTTGFATGAACIIL